METPDIVQDSTEQVEAVPETSPKVVAVQSQVTKEIAVVVPDYPIDRGNDTANW